MNIPHLIHEGSETSGLWALLGQLISTPIFQGQETKYLGWTGQLPFASVLGPCSLSTAL